MQVFFLPIASLLTSSEERFPAKWVRQLKARSVCSSTGITKHSNYYKPNSNVVVACLGLQIPGANALKLCFYQPAMCLSGSGLVLRLLYFSHICWLVCASPLYHMCNNYVTYVVAMWLYFSQLQQFRWLLCVATMGGLAQLQVPDRYQEAEAM